MSVCDDILELAASGDQGIENRPEFLAHLKACAHCRDEAPGMLSAARTIRSVPAPALTGHLTPDQIVALALDSVPAAETADRRLAQHVTGCATCAAEVREVQRAEEARSSIVSGRSGLASRIRHVLASLTSTASQGMPARLALAAGLAVLLLASKGAAGVAGAAFVVLAATLASVGSIPVESVALILGVHRLLSEGLTPTNLIGNGVATIVVAKWENALDENRLKQVLNREIDPAGLPGAVPL